MKSFWVAGLTLLLTVAFLGQVSGDDEGRRDLKSEAANAARLRYEGKLQQAHAEYERLTIAARRDYVADLRKTADAEARRGGVGLEAAAAIKAEIDGTEALGLRSPIPSRVHAARDKLIPELNGSSWEWGWKKENKLRFNDDGTTSPDRGIWTAIDANRVAIVYENNAIDVFVFDAKRSELKLLFGPRPDARVEISFRRLK